MHRAAYVMLKERCLDVLIRDHKKGRDDGIVLVSGARSSESLRRMAVGVHPVERDGSRVWVSPIHRWSKIDCNEFIESRQMARNTVVDLLHMSGECLCGAFGRAADERREIARWFPATEAAIADLERAASDAGIWYACR
jgi:3'-phosphoadenosine 5'-phosphosulfate sulfotransferase (PAPS reductase)/FAD synthetase